VLVRDRHHLHATLARCQVERTGEQHAEQHGEEDAVEIESPEAFAMLKVLQVVNDVLAPTRSMFGGVFDC